MVNSQIKFANDLCRSFAFVLKKRGRAVIVSDCSHGMSIRLDLAFHGELSFYIMFSGSIDVRQELPIFKSLIKLTSKIFYTMMFLL